MKCIAFTDMIAEKDTGSSLCQITSESHLNIIYNSVHLQVIAKYKTTTEFPRLFLLNKNVFPAVNRVLTLKLAYSHSPLSLLSVSTSFIGKYLAFPLLSAPLCSTTCRSLYLSAVPVRAYSLKTFACCSQKHYNESGASEPKNFKFFALSFHTLLI